MARYATSLRITTAHISLSVIQARRRALSREQDRRRRLRVLIACEFSGIVRDAFLARGHDAWSCDLLPSERDGNHLQCDVLSVLDQGWDLMVAHPPCTYLSYAATAHWNKPGRVFQRIEALLFFAKLWEAKIERICIENPKGCASPTIAKYTQEIQPWYFGDRDFKTTWLWLKNLAPLVHVKSETLFEPATHTARPKPYGYNKNGKAIHWCDSHTPSDDRGYARAKTFQGIANAMAEQWGRK